MGKYDITLPIVHHKIPGLYFILMRPYAPEGAVHARINDGDDDDNDFFLMKCFGKTKALVCLASIVIVLYPRGM